MLTTFLLLLTLAQGSAAPPLFTCSIEGLNERQSVIVVTVRPTPVGQVSELDVKTVTLQPVATRRNPKPRIILPRTTEPAPTWGLRTSFPRPERPFTLTVTLSDGSRHKVDPWARHPPDSPKFYSVPRPLIASRGVWTD